MLPKVFLAFSFFCFAHTTNHPFKTVGICDDFMGTRSEIAKETRINLRKTKTEGIDCEIADLPTIDMIRCHGYPAQTYEVTTDDGYILTMHRIAHGRSNAGDNFVRPVVFLQHGFLGSSIDFVIQHHSKSLGFILADNGYDVWMGNFRGNTYSRKHIILEPDNKHFWDFTIDELAHYDLPAMLSAVLEETTEGDLLFVGHGLGNTAFMAMPYYRPDLSHKIRLANFLSPMAYISNTKSILGLLASEENILQFVIDWFGAGEFLPSDLIIDCLASIVCNNAGTVGLCSEIVFLIGGFDSDQLNITLMDSFMHHSPAGSSSKTFLHILQMINTGGFHGYDWGDDNEAHHGQQGVPTYSLHEVESPVALYYGDNDLLADLRDVEKTISELPSIPSYPRVMIHEVEYENWNHMDFVWGMDAKTFVYEDLIQNLKWCESAQC